MSSWVGWHQTLQVRTELKIPTEFSEVGRKKQLLIGIFGNR